MRHSIEKGKLWIHQPGDNLIIGRKQIFFLATTDILQSLHRNITANQLINYDILRQQQRELIERQRQERVSMERMQNLQRALEKSLIESQVGPDIWFKFFLACQSH
jgi:hypothetical protein